MTDNKNRSSRRTFFLQGGAALGAGVATAGATALAADGARQSTDELQKLASMQDFEAIRQVHLAFANMIEDQSFEAAADLFDDHALLQLSGVRATGRPAIERLLSSQYRHQEAAVIHSAYRQNNTRQRDAVTVRGDRQQATATFHVDVALSMPLLGDSTVAQMARLQGQVASSRWETGRLEVKYVKVQGRWKMASLIHLTA